MFSKLSNDFSSNIDSMLESFQNNKVVFTIISVLLSLYAGMIAPKLPKSLAVLIDNMYIKLGLIFMIAYISSHNPLLSLLISLGILLSMQALITLESNYTKSNYVQKINECNMQANNMQANNMQANNMQENNNMQTNNNDIDTNGSQYPSPNDLDDVYSSVTMNKIKDDDEHNNTLVHNNTLHINDNTVEQNNVASYSGSDYANY